MSVGGMGDSTSGANLAGGIAAALLHRERTGEALEVDVSLISSAWWSSGQGTSFAAMTGAEFRNTQPAAGGNPGMPLMGNYVTADNRALALFLMQPDLHCRSRRDGCDCDLPAISWPRTCRRSRSQCHHCQVCCSGWTGRWVASLARHEARRHRLRAR